MRLSIFLSASWSSISSFVKPFKSSVFKLEVICLYCLVVGKKMYLLSTSCFHMFCIFSQCDLKNILNLFLTKFLHFDEIQFVRFFCCCFIDSIFYDLKFFCLPLSHEDSLLCFLLAALGFSFYVSVDNPFHINFYVWYEV